MCHLEQGEILLFGLYRAEGLTRGNLPYTDAFERIASQYNTATNSHTSHSELWRLLENLCKAGEAKIDVFLTSRLSLAAVA